MSIAAPVPPPPFKDRRGWLIAFGIAEILIGCLILLLMMLVGVVAHNVPASATAPQPDGRTMIVVAVMYAAIAVLFVAIGIGSIHARRWARIAMLIVSWAWLAGGSIMTAVMVFVVPKILSAAQSSASPAAASAQRIGEIVLFVFFGLFFILLPLVFVIFYSSKNVRATCASLNPAMDAVKPVPVLIVSGWFWLGIFGYLFIFARPAFPLLGMVLTGWQAIAAAAAMEAVTIWLAWNLYQQKAVAWKVAIGWLTFGWVSTIATIARFGFVGMYRAMGYSEIEVAKIESFTKFGIYAGLAFGAAFLLLLIATRKYYLDSPAVAN